MVDNDKIGGKAALRKDIITNTAGLVFVCQGIKIGGEMEKPGLARSGQRNGYKQQGWMLMTKESKLGF